MRLFLRERIVVVPVVITLVSLASLATLPIGCTVRANVGDLDALPADSGPSDATERGDATEATGDPGDAREEPNVETPIDVGCGVKFAQEGSFIDVGVVTGPPPNLAGGPIVSGTYALVAMRVYLGPAEGTMQVRETLVVRGSTTAGAFELATEARNATGTFSAYPLHGEVATWEATAGSAYFHRAECPKEDLDAYRQFGVSGDTLTLFDNEEYVERVYRRLR